MSAATSLLPPRRRTPRDAEIAALRAERLRLAEFVDAMPNKRYWDCDGTCKDPVCIEARAVLALAREIVAKGGAA